MANARSRSLASTQWLADRLDDPLLRVLDASFHLPGSGRDPRQEYARCHIPGALFFDIDGIRDESSELPHMCPSPTRFAEAAGALGIGNGHSVVVYDAPGSAAAPRAWWMFRVFGHEDVTVLDGGLAKWMAEGRAVDDRTPEVAVRAYTAGYRHDLIRDADEVLAVVGGTAGAANGTPTPTVGAPARGFQVIDNRSPGRFAGVEPEPRPARRQGHIPGSINIPFTAFVDPDRHGAWRSQEELAAVFTAAGVDLDRPLVATCGSGVTACSTALAAYLLGYDHVAVYDGSWAEWGNRDDTPVER